MSLIPVFFNFLYFRWNLPCFIAIRKLGLGPSSFSTCGRRLGEAKLARWLFWWRSWWCSKSKATTPCVLSLSIRIAYRTPCSRVRLRWKTTAICRFGGRGRSCGSRLCRGGKLARRLHRWRSWWYYKSWHKILPFKFFSVYSFCLRLDGSLFIILFNVRQSKFFVFFNKKFPHKNHIDFL